MPYPRRQRSSWTRIKSSKMTLSSRLGMTKKLLLLFLLLFLFLFGLFATQFSKFSQTEKHTLQSIMYCIGGGENVNTRKAYKKVRARFQKQNRAAERNIPSVLPSPKAYNPRAPERSRKAEKEYFFIVNYTKNQMGCQIPKNHLPLHLL